MARFKLNEKVVIFNEGKLQIAVLIARSIMLKRRTFDVRTETGYEIPYVPVDDRTCKVYIDSEKTSKIIPNILTKLTGDSRGNVK